MSIEIDKKLLDYTLKCLATKQLVCKERSLDDDGFDRKEYIVDFLADIVFFDPIHDTIDYPRDENHAEHFDFEEIESFEKLKNDYKNISEQDAISNILEDSFFECHLSNKIITLSLMQFKGICGILKEIQGKITDSNNINVMGLLFKNHDKCFKLLKDVSLIDRKSKNSDKEFVNTLIVSSYNAIFIYLLKLKKFIYHTNSFTEDNIKNFHGKFEYLIHRPIFDLDYFNTIQKNKVSIDRIKDDIKNTQEKTQSMQKEAENLLKVSLEAAYLKEEAGILENKRFWRGWAYAVLFLIIAFVISINFLMQIGCIAIPDIKERLFFSIPITFLIFLIYRAIKNLDTLISHYEHKLATINILKTYKQDAEYTQAMSIHHSIIETATLSPISSKNYDFLPHFKEFVKAIKELVDKK